MGEQSVPATKREAIEELLTYDGDELFRAHYARQLLAPFGDELQARVDEITKPPSEFRATFHADITDDDGLVAIQDLTAAIARHEGLEPATSGFVGTGFRARHRTRQDLEQLTELYGLEDVDLPDVA